MNFSYRGDVLSQPRGPTPAREVPIRPGMVVEARPSGFTGAVVAIEAGCVRLRNRHRVERLFRLDPRGFAIDGQVVTLVLPADAGPSRPRVTASGSFAVRGQAAKVARASRIWVEGIHDAELVEKVWGDDLRVEGVVVEVLDGIDDLVHDIATFAPGHGRRLGVLVDHLVPGSKESRICAQVTDPDVLITGHPYVDVWQAVRPEVAGIDAWPDVPRDVPWKEGICAALGVLHPAAFWRELITKVQSWRDVEQPLIGAVEQLIDFVAPPPLD
ncbi:MAG TPA: DUF3097 family protein [Nitriliruptorales bacterium]